MGFRSTNVSNVDFEFINSTKPAAENDADTRLAIRSHVMRNFRAKQRADVLSRSRSILSQHVMRSPRTRLTNAPVGRNHCRCKVDQSHDITSHRPNCPLWNFQQQKTSRGQITNLGSSVLDPFDTFVVSMTPTMQRVMFFCASYQEESILVPLGQRSLMKDLWLPIIRSDPLPFHCALAISSNILSTLTGNSLWTARAISYQQKAMELLRHRLRDSLRAMDNGTLGVITGLAAQAVVQGDANSAHIHMAGLRHLFINGCLLDSRIDPAVQEIIFWTDQYYAIVFNTQPKLYIPDFQPRINVIPLHLGPDSPMACLGKGFTALSQVSKEFDGILLILAGLRNQTLSAEFAASSGTQGVDAMLVTYKMCVIIEKQLHNFRPTIITSSKYGAVIECCRLAGLIFLYHVLGGEKTVTSDYPPLDEELFHHLRQSDIWPINHQVEGLLLWMSFLGWIATSSKLLKSWFLSHFIKRLRKLKLQNLSSIEECLMKFLWVRGICTKQLQALWDDFQKLSMVLDMKGDENKNITVVIEVEGGMADEEPQ